MPRSPSQKETSVGAKQLNGTYVFSLLRRFWVGAKNSSLCSSYPFITMGYYCSGTVVHNEGILLFWDHLSTESVTFTALLLRVILE